jgi:spoIIIJ-associated protein
VTPPPPSTNREDQLEVEATGETVGEAKWAALRELEKLAPGLDKSAVSFQVVSEGERGLLGVGYAPARVVAKAPADAVIAPAEKGDQGPVAAQAREVVERIVGAAGIRCRVDVVEGEDSVLVSCSGYDLGVLIGRHGHTIDAIQYLANAIAHRTHGDDAKEVIVDAEGYRERRRSSLESLAVRSAKRAIASGERVELEPMTAVERKVVHLRLKDFAGVETASEGTEPNRFVVVVPLGD